MKPLVLVSLALSLVVAQSVSRAADFAFDADEDENSLRVLSAFDKYTQPGTKR